MINIVTFKYFHYLVPFITTPEPYIAVLNGSSVTLACVLHKGATTIKWMFSDIVINTSPKFIITDCDHSTQLNINIVNTSDAGIYYCEAINIGGSSIATAAVVLDVQGIIVHNLHVQCLFYCHVVLPVVEPVSAKVNVIINETATISFIITNLNQNLMRNQDFVTFWVFKPLGSSLYSSVNSSLLSGNAYGLSLRLPSAQLHHRGTYRITVSNLAGNGTATAELDVFGN